MTSKSIMNLFSPKEFYTAEMISRLLCSLLNSICIWRRLVAKKFLEYNLGLDLFDAPDMADSLFIGRETELQEMENILQPDSDSLGSSRKVLVLGGVGGIEKTQMG